METEGNGMQFNETYDLVIKDRKTQTTRPLKFLEYYDKKEYYPGGKLILVEPPNPTLPANHHIRLTQRPIRTTLGVVASQKEHWQREGFSSGDESRAAWIKLHGKFDADQEVCVLRFIRVD
ncbi:MAG: hypothetical protein ACRDF4_04525 [Rhabdochlamydiaceae bacterium]